MKWETLVPTKADRMQEKKYLEKKLKMEQKAVDSTKAQLAWTKKQIAKAKK